VPPGTTHLHLTVQLCSSLAEHINAKRSPFLLQGLLCALCGANLTKCCKGARLSSAQPDVTEQIKKVGFDVSGIKLETAIPTNVTFRH
jgi:hypothetical protein